MTQNADSPQTYEERLIAAGPRIAALLGQIAARTSFDVNEAVRLLSYLAGANVAFESDES